MNSTEARPPGGLSEFDLYACSTLVFSAVIFVAVALYSWLGLGAIGPRIAIYTLLALLACAGMCFWIASGKRFRRAAFALAALIALEALLAAKFVILDQRHHVETARINMHTAVALRGRGAFQFHPMLAMVGKPNFQRWSVSHNSEGYRTTVGGNPQAPTVVAVGGSTTYGHEIADSETWPSQLAQRTGLNVVNMGLPGYSSAEHVLQTAFQVPDYEPTCAIYYVGWNDLQSVGMANLTADYADYHMRRQYLEHAGMPDEWSFAPFSVLEHSALYFEAANAYRISIRARLAEAKIEPREEGTLTREVDPVALGFYLRNLRTIASANAGRGIRTIFIPQILNEDEWVGEAPHPWIPHVPQSEVPRIMQAYNSELTRLDGFAEARVLDAVQGVDWRPEHFVDNGHFSAAGNALFVSTIAADIARLCGQRTSERRR